MFLEEWLRRPFCFGYFGDSASLYVQSVIYPILFMLPCVVDGNVHNHIQPLVDAGSCKLIARASP
jgi:hypothetical protein